MAGTEKQEDGRRLSQPSSYRARIVTDTRPLLILIDGNAAKVIISSHWFDRGEKLKGSEELSLAGTVTRVGEGVLDEYTPISIEVDGCDTSRVTLLRKYVQRV